MATDTRTSVHGARRTLTVLAVVVAAATAASAAPARIDAPSIPNGPRVIRCAGDAPETVARAVSAGRRPSATGSYDWPLRPFDRQHPVRGFFNDPRDGRDDSHTFHFGIDISAPDGTPVYAVKAGTVYLSSDQALAVAEPSGRILAYWHIAIAVRDRQQVRRHQLLGHIQAPWGHVHFVEIQNGQYLNPLRPGALGPYEDHTLPSIARARVRTGANPEIVVDAFDTTPMRVAHPWRSMPVTPALLTWRVVSGTRAVLAWRTGVDFSRLLQDSDRFREIYASDTRKNDPPRAGRYCFRMAGGAAIGSLPAGSYRLDVRAADTAGNATKASFPFTLR